MANPKLLQEITITASEDVFAYSLGGAQTAVLTQGRYDTILEVLAELELQLQVVDASFAVAVTSLGIVSITCDNAWTEDWTGTDADLAALLGADTAVDVVAGAGPFVLTMSNRHLYGWYAPVGVEYPGLRRRVTRRFQDTDDGSASSYASSATHRYVDLTFDACLESQIEPEKAEVADDGAGGTVDWTDRTFFDFWVDTAAKHFRFYEDGDYGTVSNVTGYWKLYRTDEEIEPAQLDPQAYTYFRVVLPCKIVDVVDYVPPPSPPPGPGATCHSCDVLIHDGDLAGAYTLFDLSDTVGTGQRRVVRIRCAQADSGNQRHAGKPGPGGGADPFPGDWDYQYGNAAVNVSYCGTNKICVIEVPTDELGQIRLKGWGTTEYRLVEWREVTYDGYTELFNDTVPSGWSDLTVGVGDLAYCTAMYNNFSTYYPYWCGRTDGETASGWPGVGVGGAGYGKPTGVLVRTESGLIEHVGSGKQRVLLAAHWALTDARSHPANPIFSGTAPTGGTVECSAAAIVGARRANLYITVRTTSGAGLYYGLRFAPSDDADADLYYSGVSERAQGVGAGLGYADNHPLGRCTYHWVETGPDGKFLWDSSIAQTMSIGVEGYELVD
jgi:hypothetical protein